MTGLLVSVRSASEARAALAGGASLIDVKEPRRGSLGAADVHVWREVAAAVGGSVPMSAALGELAEELRPDSQLLGSTYSYAKLGLAHCGQRPDWLREWKRSLESLPPDTSGVAVVYADWQSCASPDPEQIVAAAIEFGCGAVLVDTFDKSQGNLFRHYSAGQIQRLVRPARQAGLLIVLAGSLNAASIPAALELEPDFVAVRGAACSESRMGEIEVARVRELAGLLGLAKQTA